MHYNTGRNKGIMESSCIALNQSNPNDCHCLASSARMSVGDGKEKIEI